MTHTKLLISAALIGVMLFIAYIVATATVGTNFGVDTDDPRGEVSQTDTSVSTDTPVNGENVDDSPATSSGGIVPVESTAQHVSVPTKPAEAATTVPPPVSTPTPIPVSAPSGYSQAEVSLHADATSCWTIIRGNVYDLTSYVSRHPGGQRNILKICGKDGTALFENQHDGQSRPESTLAKYFLGTYLN